MSHRSPTLAELCEWMSFGWRFTHWPIASGNSKEVSVAIVSVRVRRGWGRGEFWMLNVTGADSSGGRGRGDGVGVLESLWGS